MALPPLTSVSELERRLGGTITDATEADRAAALIDDASALVRHAAGQVWVDAEGDLTAVPDLAVTITLGAALRAWYNRADVDSQQLGVVTTRFRVALTAAETEKLAGLFRTNSIQSVELKHGFGYDGVPVGWIPVINDPEGLGIGEPFPLGWPFDWMMP